jgi:6-phosphogluconolactonase
VTVGERDEIWAFIGTYTQGESEGIYLYRLDAETGAMEPMGLAARTENPSYLAMHPNGHYLYAVNEVGEFEGQPGGAVSAFALTESGRLEYLNSQPTGGAAPCYVISDPTGRFVLAANYGGGSVCAMPVRDDGHLIEPTAIVQHEGGSWGTPQRQAGPHAHSVVMGPEGRFVFVADLGLDRIMVYQLEFDSGRLVPNDPSWTTLAQGAGPRHLVFHPNRLYAYVINELDSTITTFSYDESRGSLETIQIVPTLPDDYEGKNSCADIHLAPSGRFLYGSNRGHDSIAIFAVDGTSGRLTPHGHASTQGRVPRNFAVTPDGRHVLVANQDSDSIATLRVDTETGDLVETGLAVEVPSPVCVRLLVR